MRHKAPTTPEECSSQILSHLNSVERIDAQMIDTTDEAKLLALRGARYRNNKRIQTLETLMKDMVKRRRADEQFGLQQKGIDRRERNIAISATRDSCMIQALKKYVSKEQLVAAGEEADRMFAEAVSAIASANDGD